jgi:hypothetical protein
LTSRSQEKTQLVIYLDDLEEDDKEDKKESKDKNSKTVTLPEVSGLKEQSLLCLAYLYLSAH